MLKNPPSLSFRSRPAGEESRNSFVFRARFLAEFTLSGQRETLRCAQDDSEGLGMTTLTSVFQHLVKRVRDVYCPAHAT
jgi:hypothetical protein